ncbi:EAL domain-containing protein [Photobacterium sp. SDRW27]|uniref:EAL and HDOD domain-containing protein n=1 Tax=Photobacterium obscurum TaxID=2829490 RepID=UPI00224434FB|nr:HDOD domain-containing protein [Photobacterium obscurum]MCW8327884.1 EAL domain-containing protein [Photobacterium obscurum]
MYSYVARQPILNANKKTIGYELLFRDGPKNSFPDIEAESATSRLLSEQFMNSCCNATGNKLAFVNFPYSSIIRLIPTLFPKDKLIIEILEDCEPTDELLQAVVTLSQKGYMLALDDFIPDSRWKPFLPYINIIKFDIRVVPLEKAKVFINRCLSYKIKFLAEKVETYKEFQQAKEAGFDYFQGYFFSRPEMLQQRAIEPSLLVIMQLCKEVSNPELDYAAIEKLIASDVSLSYKLLKYVNASSFITKGITSFKHALNYLGRDKLLLFISLMTAAHACQHKPQSLYVLSIQRARICEQLVVKGSFQAEPSQAFIMGLFSLLDSLLDQPLALLLTHLPLSDELKLALNEGKGQLGYLLSAVKAYEKADWEQVNHYCKVLDISEEVIASQYAESVIWSDNFTIDT